MKTHYGTPGVFSYPGFHTLKKKKKAQQIGKGNSVSKSKFNMISPIAATDARMMVQAKAGPSNNKGKKKKAAPKKSSKKTKQPGF